MSLLDSRTLLIFLLFTSDGWMDEVSKRHPLLLRPLRDGQSHLPLINPYASELVDFLLHILRDPNAEMNLKDSSGLVSGFENRGAETLPTVRTLDGLIRFTLRVKFIPANSIRVTPFASVPCASLGLAISALKKIDVCALKKLGQSHGSAVRF